MWGIKNKSHCLGTRGEPVRVAVSTVVSVVLRLEEAWERVSEHQFKNVFLHLIKQGRVHVLSGQAVEQLLADLVLLSQEEIKKK